MNTKLKKIIGKLIFYICFICVFLLIGFINYKSTDTQKINVITHSKGISVSGNIPDGKYLKVNTVMSCCDEYKIIKKLVDKQNNVSCYQIYGINICDDNDQIIDNDKIVNISIDLPDKLFQADGINYNVYKVNLDTKDMKLINNKIKYKTISFKSSLSDYFLIEKISDKIYDKADYAITKCDGSCSGCKMSE